MKSSSEIRGLKIISINEGKQISTVKDIIICPDEGCLAFFIINQPSDYFGARLIAYKDILGLGDYALVIADSSVIQDVAHNSLAVELLKKDVKVVGSQVLTTKGCLIGEVTEFMIEEQTGRIVACQVNNPQGTDSQVKGERVITYGKEIILIDDNPSPAKPAQTERKKTSEAKQSTVLNEKELLKKKIEEFGKNDSLNRNVNVNAISNKESTGLKAKKTVNKAELSIVDEEAATDQIIYPEDFNVFEQRQLQFLQGKALRKDVQLDNGLLIRAGEEITGELLSAVKTRNTLMQLTAHVIK